MVIELAILPVGNEMITHEEQSDEEDEYSEINNETTLLCEENSYNVNATLTNTEASRVSESEKSKRRGRQKKNRRGSGKRGRLLQTFLHTA